MTVSTSSALDARHTAGGVQSDIRLVFRKRVVSIASVFDEEWVDGKPCEDPPAVVERLKNSSRKPDIFTFFLPLPETKVLFPYAVEWENVAVAKTDDFDGWWQSLPQESRKNVRRSERRGVTVSQVEFTDEIARGLSRIYNETPIRQGRRFPHFGKTLEAVKFANASYLDRSVCIGAFHKDELIGFLKFVMVNDVARIMQIIAMDAHSDKRPTNALLAKAMFLACEKRASHLIYGRYIYGNKANSPVTEFKRRNGFEQLNYPRYYVPITRAGRIAMKLQLHRELSSIVPEPLINAFLKSRAALFGGFKRRSGSPADAAEPTDREA